MSVVSKELKYEWFKQSDIDRFCSHIITPNWQDNPDICWETNYAKNIQGYSVFWLNGKNQRCNRVAYSLANKCNVPSDKFVLHLCNNPKCINPKHLELGTNQENMEYMVKCNRNAKGENHPNAIRSEVDIWNFLYTVYTTNFNSFFEVSQKLNMPITTVRNILMNVLWKDVVNNFCKKYNTSIEYLKNKCICKIRTLSDDVVRQIRSYPIHINNYQIGKELHLDPTTVRCVRLFITYKDVK